MSEVHSILTTAADQADIASIDLDLSGYSNSAQEFEMLNTILAMLELSADQFWQGDYTNDPIRSKLIRFFSFCYQKLVSWDHSASDDVKILFPLLVASNWQALEGEQPFWKFCPVGVFSNSKLVELCQKCIVGASPQWGVGRDVEAVLSKFQSAVEEKNWPEIHRTLKHKLHDHSEPDSFNGALGLLLAARQLPNFNETSDAFMLNKIFNLLPSEAVARTFRDERSNDLTQFICLIRLGRVTMKSDGELFDHYNLLNEEGFTTKLLDISNESELWRGFCKVICYELNEFLALSFNLADVLMACSDEARAIFFEALPLNYLSRVDQGVKAIWYRVQKEEANAQMSTIASAAFEKWEAFIQTATDFDFHPDVKAPIETSVDSLVEFHISENIKADELAERARSLREKIWGNMNLWHSSGLDEYKAYGRLLTQLQKFTTGDAFCGFRYEEFLFLNCRYRGSLDLEEIANLNI